MYSFCQFALNGLHDFVVVAIDESRYERFLAGEILVERAHAHARDFGDSVGAELLTALAELGAKSPVTQLAIKALSHTYVVDQIFAAHLRRKHHAYTSANLNQMPKLEDPSSDIRASDHEYVDYVLALDHDQLAERIDFAFTDGAPGRMSREEMLTHVITHGVGHPGADQRGHAAEFHHAAEGWFHDLSASGLIERLACRLFRLPTPSPPKLAMRLHHIIVHF